MIRDLIYCNGFNTIGSAINEDPEKITDLNIGFILSRMINYIPKKGTVIFENFTHDLQNLLLLHLLSILKLYKDFSIVIVSNKFNIPKEIRKNNNFIIVNKRQAKELNYNNAVIFSPFMPHNYLDNKFSDCMYSKVTAYPFFDLDFLILSDICKLYNLKSKTEKRKNGVTLGFYNCLRDNVVTKEIISVYKKIHKTKHIFEFCFFNEMSNTSYNFLNQHPEIIPIYTDEFEVDDSKLIYEKHRKKNSLLCVTEDIEAMVRLSEEIHSVQGNVSCAYASTFSDTINYNKMKLPLEDCFDIYDISFKVAAYV